MVAPLSTSSYPLRLISTSGYHKLRMKILSVLCKRQLDGGCSGCTVIEEALNGFSVSLETVFPSILSFAQSAVSVTKLPGLHGPPALVSAARGLGAATYRQLYSVFPSAAYR